MHLNTQLNAVFYSTLTAQTKVLEEETTHWVVVHKGQKNTNDSFF